jgi:hypothetical protein
LIHQLLLSGEAVTLLYLVMLLRHFVLTQLLLSGEATQTPVVFNFAFISLCAYVR